MESEPKTIIFYIFPRLALRIRLLTREPTVVIVLYVRISLKCEHFHEVAFEIIDNLHFELFFLSETWHQRRRLQNHIFGANVDRFRCQNRV